MPKYIFDQNPAKSSNYLSFLILPLVLITVFCFSFVLMQPKAAQQTDQKASNVSKPSPTTQTDQNHLQALPQSQQESIPAIDSSKPGDQQQTSNTQAENKALPSTGSSNTRGLQTAPQNTNTRDTRTDKTKQTLDNLTQPVKSLLL